MRSVVDTANGNNDGASYSSDDKMPGNDDYDDAYNDDPDSSMVNDRVNEPWYSSTGWDIFLY